MSYREFTLRQFFAAYSITVLGSLTVAVIALRWTAHRIERAVTWPEVARA